MKERPILFNDEMVRALLDGRKTQTRRLVKPQPPATHSFKGYVVESSRRKDEGKFSWGIKESEYHFRDTMYVGCPCGQPGDRLWVREAWGALFTDPPGTPGGRKPQPGDDIRYRADPGQDWQWRDGSLPWRPSIHMPRWACRILLEVTAVRVERLQDITEDDARAEGASVVTFPNVDDQRADRDRFRALWNHINGADSWEANPWVWVVEFRRIDHQQEADAA